jgi:hypothetical protein
MKTKKTPTTNTTSGVSTLVSHLYDRIAKFRGDFVTAPHQMRAYDLLLGDGALLVV